MAAAYMDGRGEVFHQHEIAGLHYPVTGHAAGIQNRCDPATDIAQRLSFTNNRHSWAKAIGQNRRTIFSIWRGGSCIL